MLKMYGGALMFLCALAHLRVSAADPPGWCLVFEDDFSGDELNTTTWLQEAGERTRIEGGRWPVSNEVRDGKLHLVTKKFKTPKHIPLPKESVFVPTKRWTTGHIWTRNFASAHGYYEARLKIGNASGLNNAFWLIDFYQPLNEPYKNPVYGPMGHFEIDIAEAHYEDRQHPDKSRVYQIIHDRHPHRKRGGKAHKMRVSKDISESFHTYAVWFRTDDVAVFYMDDKEVWRYNAGNMYKGEKLRIHLSTALHRFAGKIDWGHIKGTEMVVDYVKVWEMCKHPPGT